MFDICHSRQASEVLARRRDVSRNNLMKLRLLAVILLFCSLALPAAASAPEFSMRILMNFDNSPQEPRWIAVNDGVMGGRSSGGPKVVDGKLEFSGELSLANNGGFSSVRSVGRDFDLGGASAVVLRVRGDGRRYQLRLATDTQYRGITVSYGAGFDTTADEWIEVRVTLASLKPTVRGSSLSGPPLDPSRVREIGLLIADKREGAFALAVDWIAVE
jgi:NADH dehydrogenase [ubiquinone] 1 alpha subcomplex assembly factor 1